MNINYCFYIGNPIYIYKCNNICIMCNTLSPYIYIYRVGSTCISCKDYNMRYIGCCCTYEIVNICICCYIYMLLDNIKDVNYTIHIDYNNNITCLATCVRCNDVITDVMCNKCHIEDIRMQLGLYCITKLRRLASKKHISGYCNMSKQDLIDCLSLVTTFNDLSIE